ncbi:MAG: TIGR00730 family Rossman fold protein [Chitinophagaceae bacterium]|nr:TIGR00730 family Rossman fold protein [Chitinophagaceae bacterium]
MNIRSIAVFCGSKPGLHPLYMLEAAKLGAGIARGHMHIIYGGGNKGIMGAIANAALAENGTVTGVIPRLLIEWEQQHNGLTELIVTENMHQRKKLLYELCDAAVILPGGYGTLDELFEMLTWNQLNIHRKKIFILNTNGYYNYLNQHLEKMEEEGFLYTDVENRIVFCDTPQQLIEQLILPGY